MPPIPLGPAVVTRSRERALAGRRRAQICAEQTALTDWPIDRVAQVIKPMTASARHSTR
jgi:hypothetical protein